MKIGSRVSRSRSDYEALPESWVIEEEFVDIVNAGLQDPRKVGFRFADAVLLAGVSSPVEETWLPRE